MSTVVEEEDKDDMTMLEANFKDMDENMDIGEAMDEMYDQINLYQPSCDYHASVKQALT